MFQRTCRVKCLGAAGKGEDTSCNDALLNEFITPELFQSVEHRVLEKQTNNNGRKEKRYKPI